MPKIIKLTKGYVAIVDDEDFKVVSKFKWHVYIAKRKNGSVRTVYARRGVYDPSTQNTISEGLHRFILGLTNEKVDVDHRNGNGLDCRRINLRIATRTQNNANRRMASFSSSGYRGVYFHKKAKKWMAQLVFQSKPIYLGVFDTVQDAVEVYNAKAKEIWGDFFCPVPAALQKDRG